MAYDLIVENGSQPVQVTLAAACKPGQLLGYSSGWKLANATVGTAIPAELIAGQAGAIGDKITCFRRAVLWDRDAPFTEGSLYYLDETTAGGVIIVGSLPATTGDINQMLGIAVSTERLIVDCHCGQEARKLHA